MEMVKKSSSAIVILENGQGRASEEIIVVDCPSIRCEVQFPQRINKKNTCVSQVKEDKKDFESSSGMHITKLPVELFEHILKNLSFENIAKLRLVSQYFNNICSSLLNSEFNRLRVTVQQRFVSLKAQMPRRESSRRKHPLARESDIIETLYMRLTLLNMTFGKHIERKYCCFFAGEILDEIYKILRYVKSTPSLSRAYKVTDELFDLSTMAMEYFKEHIEPRLPEVTYFASDVFDYPTFHSSSQSNLTAIIESASASAQTPSRSPRNSLRSMERRFRQINEQLKKHRQDITSVKRSVKLVTQKVNALEEVIQQLKWQQKNSEGSVFPESHKINEVLVQLNMYKHEIDALTSKLTASQSTSSNSTLAIEPSKVKTSSACSHYNGNCDCPTSEPFNFCDTSQSLGSIAGVNGEKEVTASMCSFSVSSAESFKRKLCTINVKPDMEELPDGKRICIDFTFSDNEE